MELYYTVHTTVVHSACRRLAKPKHVAAEKFVIKLRLDLFLCGFIKSFIKDYSIFVQLYRKLLRYTNVFYIKLYFLILFLNFLIGVKCEVSTSVVLNIKIF